jgi:hypothetical protein
VSVLSLVVILESVLLAVLALFVVALLRSHAEILRRLAGLEGPAEEQRPSAGAPSPGQEQTPADLVGETPDGDAIKLALSGGAPRTLLAFLSTGCAACGPLWAGLGDSALAPEGTRLVVVTKGPDRESPGRVASLSPVACDVLMSTLAWEEFAIPSTPHFVLVEGTDGQIVGRGGAGSWEQILRLVRDADQDSQASRSGLGSSDRAARAEEALERAGISAGHPSLYPSQDPETGRP